MGGTLPLAVDLFCGAGGLSQGLKDAGFSVAGAIDNDALAAKAFVRNHPHTKVWCMDIADLTAAELMRTAGVTRGQLDLLAGCPPCQGFSSVRTLNGSKRIRDPRNNLVSEFERLVRGVLPRTVMMENVPALAKDRRLKSFLRTLDKLGYSFTVGILNAADFGVPQRRRRMLLLAGRFKRLPAPSPSPPEALRKTVRMTIANLPRAGVSGDELHDLPEKRAPKVIDLIRLIPKDGGSRSAASRRQQLDCHKDFDGFRDVYGRMAWDKPAPTITGGCVNPSKGRFLHPEEDRSITLREAALLQDFPAHYQFPLERGKFAAAVLVGNALPPGFVRAHAARLWNYLDEASL